MLGAGRSGDRIPVEARFSALTQTCHGAHPFSYIIDGSSFPEVKLPIPGFDHTPHLTLRLKKV
jgi:hypothetical protein